MYAEQLRHAGLDAHVAHDVLQAVAFTERHDVDAVIIDIGLPGPSGIDLARELRTRKKTKHAVLIAVSGMPRELTDDAAFDAHFVKPCLPAVVANELHRRLRVVA